MQKSTQEQQVADNKTSSRQVFITTVCLEHGGDLIREVLLISHAGLKGSPEQTQTSSPEESQASIPLHVPFIPGEKQ